MSAIKRVMEAGGYVFTGSDGWAYAWPAESEEALARAETLAEQMED